MGGVWVFFPGNFSLASELCSFRWEELTFQITPVMPPCSHLFLSLMLRGLSVQGHTWLGLVFPICAKKSVHSSLTWAFISDLLSRWKHPSLLSPEMIKRTFLPCICSALKAFQTIGLKAFLSYLCRIFPSSNHLLSSLLKIQANLFL